MTLREFFVYAGNNPQAVVVYFAFLPLIAILLGLIPRNQRQEPPWNYLYSAIIYLAVVPGLFVLTLNIYVFLFERQSIMDLDIFSQVLPMVSMLLTLALIRKDVDLRYIPGFDKLSGLMILITAVLGLMWIADRTHVIAFLSLRFEYVVFIFIAMIILMRIGFRQVFGSPYRSQG
jgi:hypothetical protein